MTPHLFWDTDKYAEFHSLEELEVLIDQLTAEAKHAHMPMCIEVCIDDRSGLFITVGRDESHMEFHWTEPRRDGLGSIGPWDDEEALDLNFKGEISEMPRRYWVPISDAREALRRYILTGLRPDNINWG